MMQIDVNSIQQELVDSLRIDLAVYSDPRVAEPNLVLVPKQVPPENSFRIRVNLDWKSIIATFEVGEFSKQFLTTIQNNILGFNSAFLPVIKSYVARGFNVSFTVNKVIMPFEDLMDQTGDWNDFKIEISKDYVEVNNNSPESVAKLLKEWSDRILALVFTFLPFADDMDEDDIYHFDADIEGDQTRKTIIAYERSARNRLLCLMFHGFTCKVCGMDFEHKYGILGRNFIHVHHLIPVSKIPPGYKLNPINDLAPVCPNCHFMLHKKDPPLTISELQEIVLSV